MSAGFVVGNVWAWALQALAVIAAAALAERLFRNAAPRARLLYWQAVLALCLLLPFLPGKPEVADGVDVSITFATIRSASAQTPDWPIRWETGLLIALGIGVLLRLIWLFAGVARLRTLVRESQPLDPVPVAIGTMRSRLGIQAAIYLCPGVSGPLTFGLRRPVILLPPRILELPPAAQAAVCCHELLHIRRADWLWTLAEEFLRTVLWFHPAIWWALAQIQLTREQTVDREVVSLTQAREQYLQSLFAIAAAGTQLDVAPAPLFLRKRHLAQRVVSILKEGQMSKARFVLAMAAGCGLVLGIGGVAVTMVPLKAAPAPQSGENITVVSGGSGLAHRDGIEYPREALTRRVEGPVTLELSVNEKGSVTDARVLSGPEELRSAALQAVLRWHYSSEIALPAKIQVTMDFRLPNTLPPPPPTSLPRAHKELGILKRIDIEGISPAASENLRRRLPVREGEMITSETSGRILEAIRETDEHLKAAFSVGDGVALRVYLPGDNERTQQIRVGGNMQAQKLIHQPRPVYPPLAKQARMQGVVRLQTLVGKDGAVKNISVESGEPLLVEAAVEAVKQWVYETTLLNGEPVEVATLVDVNFTLSR
ncbi:MAG: M56 family metallopeptidase [Bryobacteraceae bacterium]